MCNFPITLADGYVITEAIFVKRLWSIFQRYSGEPRMIETMRTARLNQVKFKALMKCYRDDLKETEIRDAVRDDNQIGDLGKGFHRAESHAFIARRPPCSEYKSFGDKRAIVRGFHYSLEARTFFCATLYTEKLIAVTKEKTFALMEGLITHGESKSFAGTI